MYRSTRLVAAFSTKADRPLRSKRNNVSRLKSITQNEYMAITTIVLGIGSGYRFIGGCSESYIEYRRLKRIKEDKERSEQSAD